MDETNNYNLPILLYNHECEFCNRFEMALERIPGTKEINMISIHDAEVFKKYSEISFDDCKEAIHLKNRPCS